MELIPEPIDEAVSAAQDAWMDLPGVQAVAQGEQDGEVCILVLVAPPSDEARRQIPARFQGVPVVIEESGPIQAQ